MNAIPIELSEEALRKNWRKAVAPYEKPIVRTSVIQIFTSVLPFVLLWAVMAWSVHISYWLTLALSVPTAGFMMRTFIIFHDCGHGSFFKSNRWNTIIGYITGILTLTAFHYWTRDHAIHHATAGDLDRRGVGDVKVITVREYQALPWWGRAGYRIMRNPFFMFVIGAPLVFLVVHRIPRPGVGKRERNSVWITNLALLALVLVLGWTIGFDTVALVELPIIMLTTTVGVWLFYVQHQYEGVYWRRHAEWNYLDAGLKGASYYKLPRLIQWFSGNIGFHHIHHLAPKIPNYHLEQCLRENPIFHGIQPLTLRSSLRSLRLRLYDEDNHRMVGYRELQQMVPALTN
jgi:omega-6 fatty acid desaturase (delta-12 desaturase)